MTKTASICPLFPGAVLCVRPIAPGDLGFLAELYASTREEGISVTDWSAAQKQSFLLGQFQAQHAYYQEHYRNAAFDLILLDGQPIGRIYLDRWAHELRLVDSALLPNYQRRGIGSAFFAAILAEAQQAAIAVRLHVEMFNPVLTWYARLGFHPIDTHGVYYLMEWQPEVLHA
jgi:GNAT superfamily N-acetyltransferase